MNTAALLFKWPFRHRIRLLLPAMLVLAALAHAGIFFLFSVANPPLQPDGLNPARVYFLDEKNPALTQLATILASNDPALFAPRREDSTSKKSIALYTPQYASARTALLNMPPRRKATGPPSPAAAPVAIPKPPRKLAAAPRRHDSSRLIASPALAARLPESPREVLRPPQDITDPLDSASFLMGIRPDGTVAHILPSRSSGNADLDLQALQALKSLRFTPAENAPLVWGIVNFYFGSNAATTIAP